MVFDCLEVIRILSAIEDVIPFVETSEDRDDFLEKFMEKIETQVAPIIRDGMESHS